MSTVQPLQSYGHVKGFMQCDEPDCPEPVRYAPCSETGLDGNLLSVLPPNTFDPRPDQVLSAGSDTTTKPDGRVRIRLEDEDSEKLLSVPGYLMNTAATYPDHIALVSRPNKNGETTTYTYRQYEAEVRTVAKAFLKLGLERYHSVCILGFNSPEWFISSLAAMYAGGFTAGIYTTNAPEACEHCAETSRANIIVVEDNKQLQKILEIKKNLRHLKAIIQYEGEPKEEGVLSWKEVLKIGREESDDKLNQVLKTIGINECCTVVYTSGTVGKPKAVMLSHDNLLHDARSAIERVKLRKAEEIIVSYLPLSHVAAQIVDIYCPIGAAATVYFADKNALKGTLVDMLLIAKPTAFMGVPRVWEKIYEKMQEVARKNGTIKTWIASWAKAQGLYYNTNKMNGVDYQHWGYLIAKWLVFNKVKAALGLERCHVFVSAAAPLSTDIKNYFMSLDIPIMDAYGMSECGGAHTLNANDCFRIGSVGKALKGCRTKLDNPDSTGEGEVCLTGRHVLMGYLNDPEKTGDAIDKQGWLHSGDLGKLDSDRFLYITGRIKELIITAGGENIPPVRIEQTVIAELPALSNAFLVGDQRKYLTMLVTLKTDVSADTGEPLDTLTSDTIKWAKSIGSEAQTVPEIIKTRDPQIYDEIEKAIKRANNKATSNAQKIQKFQILPHDFSVATGELGPTMKIKRNVVCKMYADLIDEMYN